jgi:hypothetical protein
MQNEKFKTIMCKYFSNDKPCPLGNRCHFAHGREELRKISDPLPRNTPLISGAKLAQMTGIPEGQPGNLPPVNHNFKTMLCKYWEQGKCKFGEQCSFAHGDCEVRNENITTPAGTAGNLIDPLKVPAIEYYMRMEQLKRLCNEVSDGWRSDSEASAIVGQAIGYLQGHNLKINEAAEVLMRFLYKQHLTTEERQKRRRLVEDSAKFAEDFLEKFKSEENQEILKEIMKAQLAQPAQMVYQRD